MKQPLKQPLERPVWFSTLVAMLLVVVAHGMAAANDHDSDQTGAHAQASMQDAEDNAVGTVTYTQRDDGVHVEVRLSGLDVTQDFRGFYIHENGVCDPDDAEGPFISAGDHWAPEGDFHSAHPRSAQRPALR